MNEIYNETEIFKKIEEVAKLVSEQSDKNKEMVSLIIASPDATKDEARVLAGMSGTGVNVIETLAAAFREDKTLLEFVKNAVVIVEGEKALLRLAAAKYKKELAKAAQEEAKEESGCDNEPTTDSCGKVREERGPEKE